MTLIDGHRATLVLTALSAVLVALMPVIPVGDQYIGIALVVVNTLNAFIQKNQTAPKDVAAVSVAKAAGLL